MKKILSSILMFVLVFPISLIPTTASAATTIFTDGFESGNFNSWSANDNDWSVTNGSGHDGPHKAQVSDQGSNPDYLEKDISTVGYTNIVLNFYFKTGQPLESTDHIYVEWYDGSSWNVVKDIKNISNGSWTATSTSFSSAANNLASFKFRFKAVGLEHSTGSGDKDEFQLDDVVLTGDTIPVPVENTLELCSDNQDNNSNNLVDLADPDCASFKPKLTVTKVVVNDGGGTKEVSDFPLTVNGNPVTSGVENTYSTAGAYVVAETGDINYTASFSDSCANGNINLAVGDTKTCILTNTYSPIPVDACPNEETDQGFQDHGPCNSQDVCPNDEGVQTEGPCQSDDVCPNHVGIQLTPPNDEVIVNGQCVPPPQECNASASASYVSGITTEVSEGGNAVLLSPTHPAWTASIPGASWIWTTNPVETPTNDGDLTKVFVQHFTIVGTPTGGTLDVAADNSYSVKVNGHVVPVTFDQDNFQSSTQDSYDIGAFLVSGANTIEFTVTNWESAEQSADASANPAGLMYKVSVQNNECVNPEPEPTPTATLNATKIVCDSESDLPNWGNGGPDITASTASTFISEHPNCHVEPGWQFMWSLDGVANPGDNNLSDSISGWNTFGLTDTSGSVSTSIPSGGKIWVREVLKDGYIPFTFPSSPDNSNNISAELYCNTDVLNYDNWDWIDPVVGNTAYYCVAFNSPKLTPPPTECPLVDTPSSGWYSEYYNYKATDPFMQDGEVIWSTDRGNPVDSLSDSYQWYTPKFYKFNRVDSSLMFGSNFYPFDVAPYNVAPYADPSQRINSHEYHFGVHSSAKVIVPVSGDYGYNLASDDDAWVLVDGVVKIDNHGIHAASTQSGTINLTAGTHIVDVYFAERHTVSSELSFEFTDKSIAITPYSPLCQSEVPVCDANVELIQNGSFEEPAMGSGTWGVVPDSNPALKWLVEWFNPLSTGVLGLEIQNHVAGNPDTGLGEQFAELDGYHPVNISQNISTTPGMNYALTFKYSPRPGRDSADNALEAQAGGLVLGSSITADGTSNPDTVWTSYSRNFTATTTSTVIGFNDIGTDTSYGGYIDGVSLRCVPSVDDENPPVDVCSNIQGNQEVTPEGMVNNDGICTIPEVVVVDLCENINGNQSVVPSGKHIEDENQCVDNVNDDSDDDEPEDNSPKKENNGGGGNGPVNFGFVLGNGAPQGEVLGESCGIYINSHFKLGSSKNNSEQVKKLQTFLNKWLGSNIPVTGFYGPLTFAQVKKFQEKYGDDILKPWGLTTPTGIVYLSTVKKINQLECPELSLELPPLVPWSLNPNAQ